MNDGPPEGEWYPVIGLLGYHLPPINQVVEFYHPDWPTTLKQTWHTFEPWHNMYGVYWRIIQ